MFGYYLAILFVSLANLALAGIAYAQRAKQIRGNALRERQLELAEQRNQLAESRLECLNDQLTLLADIRDGLAAAERRLPEHPPLVGVVDVGSGTVRLVVGRYDPESHRFRHLCNVGAHLQLGAEVERLGHVAAIRRSLGREPYVLRPEEEAELAFVGATMGSPETLERAVVCDVGGGSTEVATGSPADGISQTASFDIGAFVLAERHLRLPLTVASGGLREGVLLHLSGLAAAGGLLR